MEHQTGTRSGWKTVDLVYIALFAVLIAVCSWISIPSVVPFTMQTFGIYCAVGILGGKRGTLAVVVYLLMGAVGLPVFAGFRGGIAALFGTTGGYLLGFLFVALVYWLVLRLCGAALWARVLGMALGLAVCYAFGTAWFVLLYTRTTGAVSVMTALGWCVFPYLIPDAVKLVLALVVSKSVTRFVRK